MSDLISSDYLDPVCHPNNVELGLKVEVYYILPDWGGTGTDWETGNLVYEEPYYCGTLNGLVTSANLSVDSTSDMRTTGSFSIILEENSIFIPHADDNYYWHNKWLKAIKTYEYPNSGGAYKEFTVGWFVPNDGSYTYNADTREFSMSCTDMLSYYTEARGGHLSDYFESMGTMLYNNPTEDCFSSDGETINSENNLTYGEKIANNFKEDIQKVARNASGIVLEGRKNYTQSDLNTTNYFNSIGKDEDTNIIWQGKFKTYKLDNGNGYYLDPNIDFTEPQFTDTSSLIKRLIDDYGHAIPYNNVYIDLQNRSDMLPYDIEIDADTTLYDVLKKITDLYPNQFIYFDTNRRLNIVQKYRTPVVAHARDFIDIVTDEHWNIDLSDIKNFTVVWGRDETCIGYYFISDIQYVCKECGKRDYSNAAKWECGYCGGELERIYFGTNGCSIQKIGTHKQVIYDDNILTDEEACDEARSLTYQSCRAKKTLSVTIGDCYLNIFSRPDIGVGNLIEYKSKLSGETGLYIVDKWSNNFEDQSITLELEPYYLYTEDIASYTGINRNFMMLSTPEFTYTLENGLLTMIMNNGTDTGKSLFKVYYDKTGLPFADGGRVGNNVSMNFYFLGETCTEDGNGNKIFQYQFKESGIYLITCQAWNPDMLPSAMPDLIAIHVSVVNESFIPPLPEPGEPEIQAEDVYISSEGYYFTDENGEYYVKS